MRLVDSSIKSSPLWSFVSGVTQGIGVGSITELSALCADYDCSTDMLMEFLENLKNIGYEIRNNNTNKQIKTGMILIPYGFPTLNERSLQRLTRL